MLKAGDRPDARTFTLFPFGKTEENVGSVSNPGSVVWEDILSDQHPYRRVPHTADVIQLLRTIHGNGLPLFISECGIGSAMDLMRTVRWYEQVGKPDVEDAQLYRSWRDQYLADWQRYRLDEVFARPEDFFQESIARMAGQRLLSVNAVRANPACIGHSITGTLDQGMTAEGIWTTFRELKPGTTDAIFDVWAPVRWCLFAEPLNVYRKTPVKLEAVLVNEDALPPGEYPVRLQVVGPNLARVFDKTITVTVADPQSKPEPPMVQLGFLGGRGHRRTAGTVSFSGHVRTRSGRLRRRDPVLRRRDAGGDAEGRDGGRADERRQGTGRMAHQSRHSESSVHTRPADAP